jgi:septal ring factor EnvC (AmiA/AmiB activator)
VSATLAIVSIGFGASALLGIAVAALVWKMSTLRNEREDLRRALSAEQSQSQSRAQTITQHRAQLKALRAELEQFDALLDGADRDTRRAYAERVLSLAQDRVPDGTEPELPGERGKEADPGPDLGPGPHPDWVR